MTKIKYALIIFSVFVFVLAACGQKHKAARMSDHDIDLFNHYQKRSSEGNIPADSVVYFASKALAIARNSGFIKGESAMLDRLARINEQYGNIRLAVKYQQQAIDIGGLSIDLITREEMTASLGVLKAKEGHLKAGITLLHKSLKNLK